MNKFSCAIVLFLSTVFSSAVSFAEVIDHSIHGGVYLAIDTQTSGGFLHRYDMDTDEKLASITLADTPTAIGSDDTGIYIAYGQSLYSGVINNGVLDQTLLRNFVQDVKQLIVVGDYLLVLAGTPSQAVFSIQKSDGKLMEISPGNADLFGDIEGMHYSAADSILWLVYSAATEGSLIIANEFDSSDGLFDAENILNDQNITSLEGHFFVGDQNIIVDSVGRVISFSSTAISEIKAKEQSIAAVDFITTDEIIKAVSGDADSFFVAATIDNSCHPFNPGTRIREWLPSITVGPRVIDIAQDVHSLVSYDDSLFVFWGEGAAFSGDNSNDIVQPVEDTSTFNPLTHDFDPSYSKSVISKDGTQIIMQIDDGCDHFVLRWDTVTNSYLDPVEVFWNIDDFSYSVEQNRVYMATNFDDGFFIFYVDFDDDEPKRKKLSLPGNDDGQFAGKIGKMIATDNQLVFQATLDSGDPLNVVGANTSSFNKDNLANCCDTWTNAIWDSAAKRIIYTTDKGMYQMVMTEPGNLTDPVVFSEPTISPYYSVVQAASADGVMALNTAGTRLFYRGIIYDVPGLDFVDATLRTPEMVAWVGNDLYTMENGGNEMLKWEFNVGDDSHAGTPETITLSDAGSMLFTMDNAGTDIPLSVSVSSGKALTFSEHVSADVVNSTTVGGGGSGSSGSGSTGTDSSQPAEPIGGTGGGSIDYIYLLLLTFGFAVKRRKLS